MSLKHNAVIVISAMTLSGVAPATIIDSFLPVDHGQDISFGNKDYVNRSFVASFSGSMMGGGTRR